MRKMFSANLKRAVSMLLAVAMILGAFPGFEASTAAAAANITVTPGQGYGTLKVTDPLAATIENCGFEVNETYTSDAIYNKEAASDGTARNFAMSGGSFKTNIYKGETLALTFNVPAEGWYSLASMESRKLSHSTAVVDVYFINAENMANGTRQKVCTHSFKNSSGSWSWIVDEYADSTPAIYLTKGENVFLMEGTDEVGGNKYADVYDFKLKPYVPTAPKPAKIDVELGQASTAAGSSNPVDATIAKCGFEIDKTFTTADVYNGVKLSDGTGRELSMGNGWFGVQLAQGEQLAIAFEAKADGWYSMQLNACGLHWKMTTADISVINGYDMQNGGEQKVGSHNFHYNQTSGGWVYNVKEDYPAAPVYLTKGRNLVIFKGTQPASASCFIRMSNVYFNPYEAPGGAQSAFDFLPGQGYSKTGGNADPNAMKLVDDTALTNRSFEVDKKYTTPDIYNNVGIADGTGRGYQQGSGWVKASVYKGESWAFAFNAPASGYYTVKVWNYMLNRWMGEMDIDVISGADYESGKSQYVGRYNFYRESASGWYEGADSQVSYPNNPVYLTKGKNVIRYSGTQEKSGQRLARLYGVYFTPIPSEMNVADKFLAVKAGDSVKTQISIKTNGVETDVTKAGITARMVNSGLASVSVIEEGGKYYLKIDGKLEGETDVLILNGGGDKSTMLKLKVYPKTSDLIYDFRKSYANEETLTYSQTITYGMNTVGHADELNKSVISQPWAYHSKSGYFRYAKGWMYNGFQNYPIGSTNTIKIQVNQAGEYYPYAIMGGRIDHAGGMAKIALSRMVDGELVEIVSTQDVDTSAIHSQVRAKLGDVPVYLDAGEYYVSWTVTGYSPGFDASKKKESAYLQMFELLCEEREAVPADYDKTLRGFEYDFTVMYDAKRLTQEQAAEISYADTVAAGSDPWMLYGWYQTAEPCTWGALKYAEEGKGLCLTDKSGSVRIHVPASGDYMTSVSMDAAAYSAGTVTTQLRKLKANGSPAEIIATNTTSVMAGTTKNIAFSEAPIHLDAGDYILYMLHDEGSGACINSFALNPVNRCLSIEPTELAVETGGNVSGYLNVSDENGASVDLSGSNLTVEVADASVAGLQLSIEGGALKYSFSGKARGVTQAAITVVTPDFRAAMETVKLCVNPEGLLVGGTETYDFRKAEGMQIKDVSDFAMTTAGSADEINKGVKSSPWKYICHTGKFFQYGDNANGIFMGENSASAAFAIKLSESGVYNLTSINTVQPNGGTVQVYLAPAGQQATAEDYYIGTLDTYARTRKALNETTLLMKYLDAGEYTLTYVLEGKSDSVAVNNTRFDFAAFKLQAMDTNTTLSVSADAPDSISVGQTVEVPLTVTETDSASSWTPEVDVSVTSTDENIFGYEVVSSEDKLSHSIKITAKTAGNAVITVYVKNRANIISSTNIPLLAMNAEQTATRAYNYLFQFAVPEGMNIKDIDSYGYTMAGSPDELRPGSGTDNWKYHAHSAPDFSMWNDTHGASLSQNIGNWGAIAIRLPESGIFVPSIRYTAQWQGGIFRMFIAPIDAENPRADEWYVGDFDVREDTTAHVEAFLRSRYLQAGEYIVTLELVGNSGKEIPRIWFKSIHLNPVSEHPQVDVTAQADVSILQGGYAILPLTAQAAGQSGSNVRNYAEDLRGAEYEIISGSDAATVEGIFDKSNGAAVKLIALKQGEHKLEIGVNMGGVRRSSFSVNVSSQGTVTMDSVELALPDNQLQVLSLRDAGAPDAQLITTLIDTQGKAIAEDGIAILGGAVYSYASSDESIATVDANGAITPVGIGFTDITCTATFNGVTKSCVYKLEVKESKNKSTYYTADKVANARENVNKYEWAREKKTAAVNAADMFIDAGMDETLWNMVTTQQLPRSYFVGYRADPDAQVGICRYCGVSMSAKYGSLYAYIIDTMNSPWKIQCPDCRRKFPSNDFGAFYQTGIDEYGNWSYELAKQNGAHLLTNDLYPEKGAGWGVDDGYGYVTGRTYENGTPEVHTYISYYNHWGLWVSSNTPATIRNAISNCSQAYLYTGDIRYGRIAAILLDRVADVYPAMDLNVHKPFAADSDYNPPGKVLDYVWGNGLAQTLAKSYDAVYDVYDDPYVVNFLSEKAAKYNNFTSGNSKATPNMIRENIEENILRENFRAIRSGDINGNFGMPQGTAAYTAVVLDTFPDTKEMIDWAFKRGVGTGAFLARDVTGGNIDEKLINAVDRDGQTGEIAPDYSYYWVDGLGNVVDALADYERYELKNMYNHPKYIKALKSNVRLTLSNGATIQVGDGGSTGGNLMSVPTAAIALAYANTGDPEFAQILYYANGNTANGLNYGIWKQNPETLADDVRRIVAEYGEYDLTGSTFMPGYGIAILRAGDEYKAQSEVNDVNTKRNFNLLFAELSGHGHDHGMNLGVEAYGLNMAPEFGYPIGTSGDMYESWGQTTVIHNTVEVNDWPQWGYPALPTPYHYEDAGRVKLVDVDGAGYYSEQDVDTYRRTVVMVEVDDEISYGVDFFRVVGGRTHLYTFHAMSDHLAKAPEGVTLQPQVDDNGKFKGSYAGADVPFGTIGVRNGHAYLKDVEKAENPGTGKFAVDFAITDFRDDISLDNTKDLFLRMNMLNEAPVDEVTIATGSPAPRDANPQNLKFMLVRQNGGKSFFTNVIEPYAGERYIQSTDYIPMANITRADGSAIGADEIVKAIKVVFEPNGAKQRTDYIFYALDNSVEYLIKDGELSIPFKGFVGVYTVDGTGSPLYTYLHDGTAIADVTTQDAYTGIITDYTETLEFENFVTVDFGKNIDVENIIGRAMFFNNEGYEIVGAQAIEGTTQVKISVGDCSLISKLDEDDNYISFASLGAQVRIPLSVSEDTSPVITTSTDRKTVVAGHEFNQSVSAESPVGKELTYTAVDMPRGATFDPQTRMISWTPDSRQIGQHHFGIQVSDGDLSKVIHIAVEVYKSSSGSGNVDAGPIEIKPSTPSVPSTPSAPGGPGGNSGSTTPSTPSTPSTGDGEGDAPATPAEKFIDLGNHTWAKDAVYRLVDKGVVNGTSSNTYSPAANIKRADFAIMLVRAFGITQGEGENFADVDADKYYAEELRLAKAAGIVNGVGENKFNPEGQITRQDMMLMLSRALDAMEVELSEADRTVLADFADAAEVSDYAADAVSRVVKDGIIAGANGKINPKSNATRAEIAVMLDRVLAE